MDKIPDNDVESEKKWGDINVIYMSDLIDILSLRLDWLDNKYFKI